jgi:hypothetical protein
MGVRIMRLHPNDKVMALARLVLEEKEVEEKVEEAEQRKKEGEGEAKPAPEG